MASKKRTNPMERFNVMLISSDAAPELSEMLFKGTIHES